MNDADFAFSAVEIDFDGQSIRRDTGEQALYTGAEFRDWDANGTIEGQFDVAYPVSFMRGWDFRFEVTLLPKDHPFREGEYFLEAEIDGLASNGAIVVDRVQLQRTADGSSVFGTVVASEAIVDRIDYAETVGIELKLIRRANGVDQADKTYESAEPEQDGKPMRMYVTGAAAVGAFETVLDIACRGAQGKKPGNQGQDREVVDGVWSEFADRDVRRVDGALMKYTHIFDFALGHERLLRHPEGLGQCTAWAGLLLACGAVHGLSGVRVNLQNPNMMHISGREHPIRLEFIVKAMPAQGTQGAPYGVRLFEFHQIVRFHCYGEAFFTPHMEVHGSTHSSQTMSI